MHIDAVLLPVRELLGGGVNYRKSTQRAKLPKDLGSWPLWRLSLLLSILHLIALGTFATGFLLTRIELPSRSLPADSLACNPEPPVRKVVWIIIDALRWDFVSNSTGSSNKLRGMPILQDIANAAGQAALLTRFVADPPTTTMQRLKGLMTGGLPTFIDVGSSFSAAAVTEDNLIDQLRHHDKQLAFFGDDTWMQLFPTQFQRAIPFSSFDVMDLHTVDDGVWQNLIPSIREPAEWDVVIGHYLGVDHVGHTYDVHSPHMAAKLQQMNQHVEQVVEELVSMAGPGEAHEHTLLLVFGDHGQTLTGDHGGGAPEEVDSALLALNMGAYHQIRHQQEVCTTSESDTEGQAERMLDSSMPQIDFAPTVAALMGVPIPFGNIGQISEELWNVAHSARAIMNASQVHDGSLCQEPYIQALQSNAAQVAAIFAAVAGAYDRLIDTHHRKNIHVFQFLYYISSFFGLFGSHTTSFLLSAEMYPAQVRGTAHGISAATGKVGSIAVVVWLNYLGNRNKFWLTWPFALAGAVLCWTFVADNTGLDLAEQERRWFYIRNGAPKDYHGPAVHWRHLSRWERNVLGIHKQYDPVKDAQQRREARAAHLTQAQEAIAAKKGLATLSAKQKLADGQV